MHKVSNPAILYFGTPVVLVSTMNNNGSYNLAPISSVFWLGWRCVIGLGRFSKTAENLLRSKECVLNLPSEYEVAAVDRLALTTGTHPVPPHKQEKGYRYEPEKFQKAGLTAVAADLVEAPRAMECPVHLEARLVAMSPIGNEDPAIRGRLASFELEILRVHLEESVTMAGHPNRVDPYKWRPLIMSFQKFYGLSGQVFPSTLSSIPENLYAMK